MKKKVGIAICIMVLVVTIGAFAAVQITESIAFNNLSKFDQMVTILSEGIEDDAEFNLALLNYKFLEDGYKVSNENMDYIAELIIDGYNGEDVIGCAYFWLDTSEDISLIEKMCNWKEKNTEYKGNFWMENAFDAVTKNKCGVLTLEDIEMYAEKGLTDDKIMIADRLCRKGVYTIQEILTKHIDGKAMVDIALEIEGSNLVSTKNYSMKKPAKENGEVYPKVEDEKIFKSRELAIITNEPEKAFYDTTEGKGDIETELNAAREEIAEKINNELREGKYLRTRREKVK